MAYKICPVCKTKNEPNSLLCKNCSTDISSVSLTEDELVEIPLVLFGDGFTITIIKPTILGREGIAKSYFVDKAISRRHAKIFKKNDQWYIQDLGSTNGTYLNAQKLSPNKHFLLKHNDVISLSQKIFLTVQYGLESDKTIKENYICDKTEKEPSIDGQTVNKTIVMARAESLVHTPRQIEGYEIIKHLFLGGESDTYLVQKDDTQYVLKIYRKDIFPDLDLVKNIKQLTVEHPQHLVRLIDFGETQGSFFEIYEYCKLGSISELLHNKEYKDRFASKEIFYDFLKQVNEALKVLHSHNIYHRDLKPSNILLRDWFEVVLCDFGIAKSIEESTVFTKNFKGTYKYSAPETFSNEYNKKSDYWSLGMILYLLYFGKEPFEGVEFNSLLSKIAGHEPIPIETSEQDIKEVLEGLLQKDSSKRWGAEEIDRFLNKRENYQVQNSKQIGLENFDETSARNWQEAGFDLEEAKEWRDAGFRLHEALLFKKEINVKPEEAKIAQKEGLVFDEIKQLKRGFYTLLENKKVLNGAIKSIRYSPQGDMLACGGNDYTIRLLSEKADQEFAILELHTDCVQSVAFSKDGEILASASKDKTVSLWDVSSKKHLARLEGHQSYVTCVAFSPVENILASGSWDMQIRLWNIETKQTFYVLKDSKSYINSIDFNHNGTLLACGTEGGNVIVWELRTKEAKAFFDEHKASVRMVTFHPLKNILASGSEDGSVILWDYQSKEKITLFQHNTSIKSVAFNPSGTVVAVAGEEGDITIWDIENRSKVTELSDNFDYTEFMKTVPMQDGVLAIQQGKTIELWNLYEQKKISSITLNRDAMLSLAYNPKGDLLVAGGLNGKLQVWSSNLFDVIQKIKEEGFRVKEFLSWFTKGFSLQEAKRWHELGFESQKAIRWKKEGFLPNEAKKWIEYGFDVRSVLEWKNIGFLPNVAKNLVDDGFSIDELLAWIDQGFSLEEAREWKKAGFDIEEAKEWKAADISVSKAKRYRKFGFIVGKILAKLF
ncbi:protein kinase domain-containing protein [Nitrosophilus labii]|uniref:protein kinase domain-containing protein n=1 Tax=Nitrosophilus labii TaxID=2706014 RepID=UPI001656BF92|nr:protein kinase [Nitrosophilus labii]